MTPHKRMGWANKKESIPKSESNGDLNQNDLLLALDQLYQLLEEHAPSWYTQQHHEIAEAALRPIKKH
jgi:hypothetical protein